MLVFGSVIINILKYDVCCLTLSDSPRVSLHPRECSAWKYERRRVWALVDTCTKEYLYSLVKDTLLTDTLGKDNFY